MTMLCVMALLHSGALASTELVQWPSDVSAQSRGVNAVGFDPAAAGRAEGFELQLRERGRHGTGVLGAMALSTTIPIGDFSLYGGFEWGAVPRPTATRLNLGSAVRLTPELALGVTYRSLWPNGQTNYVGLWDVGLLAEIVSWLSLSVGIDAFNAPDGDGIHIPRALRVGVAIRPIMGKPWLTLAADTRLVGGFGAAWLFVDTRTWADVQPWEGVHLGVGYQHVAGENSLWGGVGVDLFGANVNLMARADNGAQETGVALTIRTHPVDSLVRPYGRTVDVPLEGALEGPETWLRVGKAIPTVILTLDALADNAGVDTVVLPIKPLRVGMGTVDELRAAIGRLRAKGKRVIAELHAGDDKTYMVAAAANHIRLDPLTTLYIDGFAVTHHFYAGALAKIGARFDAVGVGKYKSGPDPLTRETARPEDQEVENEILSLAQATLSQALEKDRKLDPGQVTQILAQGTFEAETAIKAGLADELTLSPDPNVVPPRRPAHDTVDMVTPPSRQWSTPPIIAVVPVVGTIVGAAGDNPLPGASADAGTVLGQLRVAGDDPRVAAVVLRVDSPGGDVYASELIWREVKRLAAHKPVIASMGDVAASGGYYVSAPAHVILAQPNTVTGSIGIFTVKPDLHGTLEWLGVHGETYKSTENADWNSYEHGLSDDARQKVLHNMESLYGVFVGRVASGRHLPETQVRAIAEGRPYTGARAKELGLVDGFGGLADAVRMAQAHAGLAEDADVLVQVPDRDFNLQQALGQLVQVKSPVDALLTDVQKRLEGWDDKVLAIMPGAYEGVR